MILGGLFAGVVSALAGPWGHTTGLLASILLVSAFSVGAAKSNRLSRFCQTVTATSKSTETEIKNFFIEINPIVTLTIDAITQSPERVSVRPVVCVFYSIGTISVNILVGNVLDECVSTGDSK